MKYFLLLILLPVMLFSQEKEIENRNQFADSLITNKEPKNTIANVETYNPFPDFFYIIPNAFIQIPQNCFVLTKQSFSLQNVPNLLTISLATASLMVIDQKAFDGTDHLYRSKKSVKLFHDFTVNIGDGKYQLLTAGLFSSYGLMFSDKRAIKTSSNLIEALVSTGLVVQVLKRVFGRESPAASSEYRGEWEPFPGLKVYQKNQPKYYSYPSGHMATTMTVVAVLTNNYPEQKWIAPVGYSIAGIVGIGLVAKSMHWYSDLPLGAAIGYSIGNLVSRRSDGNGTEKQTSYLMISPIFLGETTALAVSYSF